MEEQTFDAIVLGSGQGGNPLAKAMAQHGWRVAMIEREHIGGTCVNVGCTPSKTMVASARVAYLAGRSDDFGIRTREVRTDMPAVIARKREIVQRSQHNNRKGLEETENLELFFGEGSFAAEQPGGGLHAVTVRGQDGDERRLLAERVFVGTGERPTVPKVDGLSEVPFLDSTSIMELEVLPEHLIVLGGGVIAVEFAQMFRRFGSEVTIVERGKHLLGHEDEDISVCMEEIFREDGIALLLESETKQVNGSASEVVLTVKHGGMEKEIRGSHLLVATGRTPNVEALGLEHVALRQDGHGHIEVNPRLETNVKGIWAIGDVNGGPAYTHFSYDDYRVLKTNLLDNGSRTTADRIMTYCVFTDPEIGRVGMSEAEARKSGKKLLISRLPMTWMARATEMAESRGMLKAIVDGETELILGATVFGVDGGEVAAQIQIAMMARMKYTVLRDGIFSHPTRAEILNNLFTKLEPVNE